MLAEPPDSGLAILDAFAGGSVVSGLDPVVRGYGNHASRSKIAAMGVELAWRTFDPAPTEEKHNGWTFVRWFVIRGIEDIEFETIIRTGKKLMDFTTPVRILDELMSKFS